MIVVDTSVWIEFFKGRGSFWDRTLASLIQSDMPIAVTEVIYCEVLQGIRDDAVFTKVRDILQAFPVLPLGGLQIADRAVGLYRACRKKGYTIRSTVDCFIAAVCLDAGAALFHRDRDFDVLAKVSGLEIYHP